MEILDGVKVISVEGKKSNEIGQFGIKIGMIGVIQKIEHVGAKNTDYYFVAFNNYSQGPHSDGCIWVEPHQIRKFKS